MVKLLLIGLGGGVGALCRYWASLMIQQSVSSAFPLGTLSVNVVGCLIIGILAQLTDTHGLFSPDIRALLFTGFLGGFTTFSTFGNETLNLVRGDQPLTALLNVGLHLGLGLGAVWAGRTVVTLIWR